MPQKQRAALLRSHYSSDLKRHVIYQAFTLHKSTTEIAFDLDMSIRLGVVQTPEYEADLAGNR